MKANADKVTYANAGIGAASHLCGMLFMSAIDTTVTDRALQGHRPGDDRPRRRPGRLHVRPDHQHDRPDQGRRDQGLRGDHARAARHPAGRADHGRRRPAGLRGRRLARPLRARRHARRRSSTSSTERCRPRCRTRTSSQRFADSAPRRSSDEPTRRRRRSPNARRARSTLLEADRSRRPAFSRLSATRARLAAPLSMHRGAGAQLDARGSTERPRRRADLHRASALAFARRRARPTISARAFRMGPGYFPLVLGGAPRPARRRRSSSRACARGETSRSAPCRGAASC